jgi:hypothetical protein
MTHRDTERRSDDDRRRRLHRDRLRRHWMRRRLAAADDVAALEAYQRDLEQEAADVAQRIRALRAQAS